MTGDDAHLRAWFEEGKKIPDPQRQYTYFTEGFRKDPGYRPWAWAGIGIVWLKQGNFSGAMDAFEKALEINPQFQDAITGQSVAREALDGVNNAPLAEKLLPLKIQQAVTAISEPAKLTSEQEVEKAKKEKEEIKKQGDEMIRKIINIERMMPPDDAKVISRERARTTGIIAAPKAATRPFLQYLMDYLNHHRRDPNAQFFVRTYHFNMGSYMREVGRNHPSAIHFEEFGTEIGPDSVDILDRVHLQEYKILASDTSLQGFGVRLSSAPITTTHLAHILVAIDLTYPVQEQLADIVHFELAEIPPTIPHLLLLNYETVPEAQRESEITDIITITKQQLKDAVLRVGLTFPISVRGSRSNHADALNAIFTGIADEYKMDSVEMDQWFTVLYAAMVAEENKRGALLGKRIKRLGIHQVLIDEEKPEIAANFSRNKK